MTTFTSLEQRFDALHQADRLTTPVPFDLAAYMTRKRVTIAALAAQMGISQARVRQVRAMNVVPFLTAWDFALGVLAAALHRAAPANCGCRGWNFHVFTLGADRCSICGGPARRN